MSDINSSQQSSTQHKIEEIRKGTKKKSQEAASAKRRDNKYKR